jgi:chromosomal replication initiation ATPase DnaA
MGQLGQLSHAAWLALRVAPKIFDYLVRGIERSFAAASSLAARLGQHALETGQPITISLARAVLMEET